MTSRADVYPNQERAGAALKARLAQGVKLPGPQVDQLVSQILDRLPGSGDLDTAVERVRAGLEVMMPGLSRTLEAELAEAREIVRRQYERIEILHRHSVVSRRPKWYFGPRPGDIHWPALRDYLLIAKRWDEDDVRSVHEASNEVVSLLENPAQLQFSCRGLVVGHVQSGKTANMTAVIAKALDAGYNTVIVLAGLTNKLRHQTQMRMFNDLVLRHPLRWQVLTSNEMNRDFRAPAQGGFLSHVDKAQLAVVKKNVSPLGQLRTAVERTLPAHLAQLRILLIDDECDQATVNSARGELDMTAINARIRELLAILPAVSYVGYTATPFANVLINPYRIEGVELDDLYPRDFITALPKSPNYFGTEELFGRPPADADNLEADEEGLDMIREVDPEEEVLLQPTSRTERDAFQPQMTDSLESAILYYMACCAARRARGHENQHMTMLVHTSAFVIAHERLAALIEGWVDIRRDDLLDPASESGMRMAQIWNDEQGRLPPDITDAEPVTAEQLWPHMRDVLRDLEFPIENGSSEDRIDYGDAPRTYIVVGGSILARGLTLEGLMVSYFLRTASQYDTLLQMGRWFGYRLGYEDLPRLWMTDDLKMRFRALAQVEQEIRDDIDRYRSEDLTPMQAAVRIRAIPGMAITSANRMRAARPCAISYWGTHRQTFRFEHRNEAILRTNWAAAEELVSRSEALGRRDRANGKKLWRRVPRSSVLRFFETYRPYSEHGDLRPSLLLPFLRGEDDRLAEWNVGIVETARARRSRAIGTAGQIGLVTRARLRDTGDIADIKALMSRSDIWFDCEGPVPAEGWDDLKEGRRNSLGADVPLLLLYGIDRESQPRNASSSVRVGLDAVDDVLGYGLVFPGSVTEGDNFVSVVLDPLSADEIERIAEEEEAQAEAAGVS